MKTAANYLDAIREKYALNSDRKAAALLGIKNAARLRTGEDSFSDTTAAKVAELLEADPGEILIASHAERAKTERERALWLMLAKKAGYAASAALFCAAQLQANGGTIDIMSTRRRRPGFRNAEQSGIQSNEQARQMRAFLHLPS